jgi:hypothetical protein
MQLSTFVTIALTCLCYSGKVFAQNPTGASSPAPTPNSRTCATITTTGLQCPTLFASCTLPACLKIEDITVSCGCASIFTTTICATACPTGCAGTTYSTQVLSCSSGTSTTTTTSQPGTTTTVRPTTFPTSYTNGTITATSITTLKPCSDQAICSSQLTTSTVIVSPSPYSAAPTCIFVLTGSVSQIITGSTIVVPTKTTSTSSSSTNVLAGGANKRESNTLLSGLIVAILGLL